MLTASKEQEMIWQPLYRPTARGFDLESLRDIFQKARNDMFRHWILGLGSGDLIVKTPRGDHFDMHNVLFVGRKVAMIEDMMREKAVVRGG